MQPQYSSVTQLYVDLRDFFVGEGFPVVRTVVPGTDVVLDLGNGQFFRLQKVDISPSVAALGWAFGLDSDLLSTVTIDAERMLPFALQTSATLGFDYQWDSVGKRFAFHIPEALVRWYEGEVNFSTGKWSIYHRRGSETQFEPNFKDTGAPYYLMGA